MIIGFIVGLLLGLYLGGLAQRKLIKQLRRSAEALRSTNAQQFALTARLNAANAALAMLSLPNKDDEEEGAA